MSVLERFPKLEQFTRNRGKVERLIEEWEKHLIVEEGKTEICFKLKSGKASVFRASSYKSKKRSEHVFIAQKLFDEKWPTVKKNLRVEKFKGTEAKPKKSKPESKPEGIRVELENLLSDDIPEFIQLMRQSYK